MRPVGHRRRSQGALRGGGSRSGPVEKEAASWSTSTGRWTWSNPTKGRDGRSANGRPVGPTDRGRGLERAAGLPIERRGGASCPESRLCLRGQGGRGACGRTSFQERGRGRGRERWLGRPVGSPATLSGRAATVLNRRLRSPPGREDHPGGGTAGPSGERPVGRSPPGRGPKVRSTTGGGGVVPAVRTGTAGRATSWPGVHRPGGDRSTPNLNWSSA